MGGFINFSFCIAAAVTIYHSGYAWLVWIPVGCAVACLWSWLAIRHRTYVAARARQRAFSRERSSAWRDSGRVSGDPGCDIIAPTDEDFDKVPNWMVDVNLLATAVALVFLIWQVTLLFF